MGLLFNLLQCVCVPSTGRSWLIASQTRQPFTWPWVQMTSFAHIPGHSNERCRVWSFLQIFFAWPNPIMSENKSRRYSPDLPKKFAHILPLTWIHRLADTLDWAWEEEKASRMVLVGVRGIVSWRLGGVWQHNRGYLEGMFSLRMRVRAEKKIE